MIFFLHIPRTMGTFLANECLYPNYQPDEIVLNLLPHSAVMAVPGRFDKVKIICGHVGYNLASVLGHPPNFTLTLIRNPIYRAYSMYYFCQRAEWFYLHRQSMDMTLPEFANDPETAPLLTNWQSRQITCDLDYHELVRDRCERNEVDRDFYGAPAPADDELLCRAKQRLDEFDFVGVSSRFYESVKLLWPMIGIEQPKLGPNASRQMHPYLRSKTYMLKTDEYEALEQINKVDLALFEYAHKKLDELLRREVTCDT